MNIAVFTDLYTPGGGTGGIISSIAAQKIELERLGHQVTIFCPGLKTTEKHVFLVPTFAHLKINGAMISRGPKTVMSYIRQKCPDFNKFDVIHVNYEGSCSIAGVLLAKDFNIPLVQTMHGREDMAIAVNVPFGARKIVSTGLKQMHQHYLPHKIKVSTDDFQAPSHVRAHMWQLMANHAECADVVTAPSNHFGKKLKHYGVKKPIVVVPNGLPAEFMEAKVSVREYRADGPLKMIWNSRVSTEKRFMPFLQALRQLQRPYEFYVYGDGNELKKGQTYAKKHRMNVKFFGARPRGEIIETMKKCHLGICTSYNFDTQGMVLIEAEATGLPVFLCDPELTETLPQGGYILADRPDTETMAKALNLIKSEDIKDMSKVMLTHRKGTAQTVQIKKLLEAYILAIKKHTSEN